MRVLIISLLCLAGLSGLALLGGCQRWSPNDPARMSNNPELQMLRDSRRGGLRTRCAECHAVRPELPSGRLKDLPATR